ncbi:DUF6192 family protein [Streptomyces sp. TX20-6-3]|uniref:DUF6192 family protein n=1 Tax=Streptomyces sp. TX20-6-3 TaxID=3028705 RepID=UPI0029B88F31|nr:DUF6192 family protein [Streptomyces sp. TX20-6-3]MDX2565269.1 DUF6192 family protein [Streptomyces sp. TX20-6-3]
MPDEEERWVAIEDAAFSPHSNRKEWTASGARCLVGNQVDSPVSVEEEDPGSQGPDLR